MVKKENWLLGLSSKLYMRGMLYKYPLHKPKIVKQTNKPNTDKNYQWNILLWTSKWGENKTKQMNVASFFYLLIKT